MSTEEAREYVDLVIEQLVEWGVITQERYGRLTEAQQSILAEMLAAKSEE